MRTLLDVHLSLLRSLEQKGYEQEQAKELVTHLNDLTMLTAQEVNKDLLSEMKRLEDKVDTKFTMIMWVMGILVALVVALKFVN